MRILAIRGRNLASLYGTFELRLDGGPIAEAGLFSIAGPTGAGKSTLVDALCLALYGRTPRLGDRSRGVKVGREEGEQLDADDERGILSHGTAEAMAEVEFEGIDGRRWRAQWSVKRAHGKPGGKLQAARMALWDGTTGEAVSDRVSEVPSEVRARIGYDFAEFRRAVVLPQFQFRAFLDARPDERAAILEKVTGVDVYSRLSRAAHERASAESEKLERLAAQGEVLRILSEEERAALTLALEGHQAEVRKAAERAGNAEEAVRWHQTFEVLSRELSTAEAAELRARDELALHEPLRGELAEVERAQPLRAAQAEVDRAAGEAERARWRAGAAETRRARAAGVLEQAREAAREAALALESTSRAKEDAQPELRRARELDAQLGEATRRANDASAQAEAARSEAEAAKTTWDGLRLQARAALDRREQAEAWLREHAPEAPLAAEWPRWQAELRRHASHQQDLGRALARLGALGCHLEDGDDLAARIRSIADEAGRAHAQAEEVAREATAAAEAFDPDALGEHARTAAARLEGVTKLSAIAAEVARADGDVRRAEGLRDDESLAAGEADARLQALREPRREAAVATEEARAALERIQSALSLDDRRASLTDGEPCPLCGSSDHPWARAGAPGAALEHAQRAAVKAREERLRELDALAAQAKKEAEEARLRAGRHDEEARRHRDRREKTAASYRECRAAERLDDAPQDPLDGASLDPLVRQAETSARAAQGRLAEALEVARAASAAAGREEGKRRLADAAATARDVAAARERLEDELDPPLLFLGAWRPAARSGGTSFVRRCGEVAAAHAAWRSAKELATKELAELEPELAGAGSLAAEKAIRARDLSALAEDLEGTRGRISEDRARRLGGRGADEVAGELERAIDKARAARESAVSARGAAESELAAATQERETAAELLKAAEDGAAAARAALVEGLARASLDAQRLAALLGRPDGWLDETRRTLRGLEDALREARTLVAERKARLDDHAARGRPEVDRAGAEQQRDEARAAAAKANEAAKEAELALRADDVAREALKELGGQLEAQRAAVARWQALSDLIGSADGKRFRVFAQGLALDALLAAANGHLEQLARRYELARAPGSDLDLQVIDHDLGDEPRSVNGLSGGESFLVSLALALGLSSLSSSGTQSRTLLIDEGFGTLDRDTLEHAMFALETLRASGRTVGVISHVPELHDRIGVQVTVEKVSATRSRVLQPT